ncbi:MAG: PAS domain S-box protein, partial [Proteobacteria bacterium]|nr:PAS domain S-box protein [Pseudomonadota bacterium]
MPFSSRFSPSLMGVVVLVAVTAAAAIWLLVQEPSLAAAVAATGSIAAILAILARAVRPTHRDAAPAPGDRSGQPLQVALQDLEIANRAARMGQWEWRLGNDSIWWSPEVCELHGVSGDSVPRSIGEALALVHPDDHARILQMAQQARQESGIQATHFRIRRPDGGVRSIAAEATAIEVAPGDVVIRGVQRDVTELTQFRRRLQLAEAQHRFLFEHSPVPMWVFDRDTLQLLAVNEEASRKFGYDVDDEPGSLVMQDFNRLEHPAVHRARQHGASDREEDAVWTYQREDGTTLHTVLDSQELDFEGRPARLVAAQDASDQQRAENLYRLVAAATNDAIYEWDISRNALWISEGFFQRLGYERMDSAPTIDMWKSRIHP